MGSAGPQGLLAILLTMFQDISYSAFDGVVVGMMQVARRGILSWGKRNLRN